jgi:hypothetical protein
MEVLRKKMEEKKAPKSPQKILCLVCDFVCYKKRDYERHILTLKHEKRSNGSILGLLEEKKPQKAPDQFTCKCNKLFKTHGGLWKHQQKCTFEKTESNHSTITDSNLIIQLLKQNDDIKHMLLEQNTKMIETFNEALKHNNSITTTNNHVNSHNKTFNMNVFLNEHCKDAMNISEFVDSIQLGFNDLVNVGKVGYVEGISSIIINKLRSLDIHKRPMHCGDEKRHSMYIKEDGKWEKQPEDNNRVRRLIKQVAFKNTKNTVLFKEKYPDCGTSASKYSDQYNKIVMESFGGRGASDEEKENKIVRMIAKEVYIDKTL